MKNLSCMLLTLTMVLTMLAPGVSLAASDAVRADADALTVNDILSVPAWDGNRLIDNLDLDCYTEGEVNGSPITWSSSDESVISTTGIVTRGAEDAEVTVTATIGTGDDTAAKDFTFVVPAASKSINGMPVLSSLKYEDTFSDGTINTSKFASGSLTETDSVVEENGKMTLTRSAWTSGEPYMEIIYEYNGYLSTTLEMTLHSTSAYVRIPFIGYNWNGYPLYIHWYPVDNQISIGVSQTQDANLRIDLPESAKGKKAKFTVTVNAPAKTYDIWVNNELVANGSAYMQSAAQKPYRIRVVTLTTDWMYGVGSIAMDNLKIYESTEAPALTTVAAVDKSLASAISYTENKKTYLIDTMLDLSTVAGTGDAAVAYEISDNTIISEAGKVTRALTDKNVTVTANVTAGGETLRKAYKYVVPGKYNKIGRNGMPLIDKDYPVSYTVTDTATSGKTDSSVLTAFSENNGRISFTSAYASNVEPGFTYKYSDNLKNTFVQDVVFTSDSNALRMRISDSSFGGKMDIYYLDNGTIRIDAVSTENIHPDSFKDKVVKLTLAYNMNANTVDIYVNGTLWLDDFALLETNYKNIQHIMVSHHCATIAGAWRSGQGTTTVYSLNAYSVTDDAAISSIMATEAVYSNGGTVAAGDNTAAVTVVAGDSAGERGGMLAYAIYSNQNGTKKLEGIDVVSLGLDEFSHREYTATVVLDAVPENVEQKLFIWGDSGLTPLETAAFPGE